MVSLNGLEGMDLRILESVARRAIEQRIRGGASWSPDPAEFDDVYAVPGATFVTLRRHGSLRGCIGQLEPTTSVIESAARNAELAALADRRFSPVGADELGDLDVHVAVLGPLEPVSFTSEDELLASLTPLVHGLVLEANGVRATFLPSVWAQIADPRTFLRELKRKAGWDPGLPLPASTAAFRYEVAESPSEDAS